MKSKIIELVNKKIPQRRIAEIVECSQNTIIFLKKKFEQTGSVLNHKSCGRPRAITKRDDRELRKIVKNMRRATSKEINEK